MMHDQIIWPRDTYTLKVVPNGCRTYVSVNTLIQQLLLSGRSISLILINIR